MGFPEETPNQNQEVYKKELLEYRVFYPLFPKKTLFTINQKEIVLRRMNLTQSSKIRSLLAKPLVLVILNLATVILPFQDTHPTKIVWPNAERGGSASGSFVDRVNVFSGTLSLSIPIGSMTTPAGFSFSLNLFYDSNIWNVRHSSPGAGGAEELFRTSSLLPSPFEAVSQFLTVGPIVDPKNYYYNAGPGWLFSPGRIIHMGDSRGVKVAYAAPNHSRHHFFESLHPGETPQNGVWYTRDASYLKFVNSDNGNWTTGYLHFPNGVKHYFVGGVFQYMEDPFGNRISLTIDSSATQQVVVNSQGEQNWGPTWTFVEETSGKRIRAGFTPNFIFDPETQAARYHPSLGLLQWIEVDAPGTQPDGSPNVARYETQMALPEFSAGVPVYSCSGGTSGVL